MSGILFDECQADEIGLLDPHAGWPQAYPQLEACLHLCGGGGQASRLRFPAGQGVRRAARCAMIILSDVFRDGIRIVPGA